MLRINAGSGRDYRSGWVNVDIDPEWKPDVVCDLASSWITEIPNYGLYDEIFAGDLLEHVKDLPRLMYNFLHLLKIGGKLIVHVPYDLSYGAWQDPTHVRAFNERSWIYYTDWFWYLGWKYRKFYLESIYYEYSDYGQQLSAEGYTLGHILRVPRAVDAMKVALIVEEVTEKQKEEAEKCIKRNIQ